MLPGRVDAGVREGGLDPILPYLEASSDSRLPCGHRLGSMST